MVINQGDVFWVELGIPIGSAPGYRRPHVVVDKSQLDEFIGALSPRRIRQILDGLKLITEPREIK